MNMRAARVFRWIMRIFILLLTLSLSVVTILGGLSAVNILSDSNNIQVPPSGYSISYNVTGAPNTWYINIPIGINNVGYFDLNNLEIEFILEMTYDGSSTVIIYSGSQNFGNIESGNSGIFEYNATSFTVPAFSTLNSILANITVYGYYSLDLIQFEIHVVDFGIYP
ncbi:MAG: hypothetical protein JXA99_05505 [Candidatus Lokiarchaeota archaeon]|nr:hypothetical protein [Candidatus Lokiarchaeota archaeon]